MNDTQKRVKKVLENMINLAELDGDYADWFSDELESYLSDLCREDAFGSEGQSDPRGDQRDGEFNMQYVQGVDDV